MAKAALNKKSAPFTSTLASD